MVLLQPCFRWFFPQQTELICQKILREFFPQWVSHVSLYFKKILVFILTNMVELTYYTQSQAPQFHIVCLHIETYAT